LNSFEPRQMSIVYPIAPSLLLVTWCLALNHTRECGKMANERDKKWNLLGISKPYWSFAKVFMTVLF